MHAASRILSIGLVLALVLAAAAYADDPETGTLVVTSSPPALVVVDGSEIGWTPVTGLSLPTGAHRVVLRSGARSIRRTVMIRAGETTRLVIGPDDLPPAEPARVVVTF